MERSAASRTLDLTAFLDRLGMVPFHYRLLFISSLVTFFDGLDFSLIAFTLPYLRDEMHLSDAMTGYVSSAAFMGQMIGSLVGSYLGDLFGRRPVILWCTILSAVLTFLTGFAETPMMLIVLRLFGGLSIGGLLAPAWAINIESMPAGKKATSVTVIMMGFSIGGAAAGQVTNLVAPHYGWEGVFFACGAATLVLAIILQFTMQESVRWMAAKGRPASAIMPTLRKMDPSLDPAAFDAIVLSDEGKAEGRESPWAKSAELFRGTLKWITPVIWFTYFCSSFAIYLKASFGVLFLEKLEVPRTVAANISSLGTLVGAFGGVFLLMATERRGPGLIALAPLLGAPAALAIGLGLDSGPLFIPLLVFGSIMVGAGHAAVISLTSIYYPSAVRSTGGGWASFMAKFAAVAAPIIGGYLFLSSKRAVQLGYTTTTFCLLGVVAGLLILAVLARRLAAERQANLAEAAPPGEAAPAP